MPGRLDLAEQGRGRRQREVQVVVAIGGALQHVQVQAGSLARDLKADADAPCAYVERRLVSSGAKERLLVERVPEGDGRGARRGRSSGCTSSLG